MLNIRVLIPAYGRIYENKDEALTDWKNGKDFRILENGCYCSIRNIEALQYLSTVYIALATSETFFKVDNHD